MRTSRINRFMLALLAIGALAATIGCIYPRQGLRGPDGRYDNEHHDDGHHDGGHHEGDHDHDHDHDHG